MVNFPEKCNRYFDKTTYDFTEEDDAMEVRIDGVLYIDRQAALAVGFCGRCGSEVYVEGGICVRCEAMGYDPA